VTVPLVGLPQEISTVESTAEVAKGVGDFVLATYWAPTPLPANRQFFFQVYGTSPVIEAIGLTVSNMDAATAPSSGLPEGYSVQFTRVFPVGNQEPPVTFVVPIDPIAITGPIVLRLSFEDATDLMTGSFSLDGGVTFQSPFPAIQAFELAPDGELLLGAAAIPAVEPPPSCPYSIAPARVRFQRMDQPSGDQAFRMSGTAEVPAGYPPSYEPPIQGVTLSALSGTGLAQGFVVPGGGAPPNAGCGPKDGWKQRGLTYTYTNESNLLPPACSTSANGLRKVKLVDTRGKNGRIKFSLLARPTSFSSGSPLPAAATIELAGPGGETICASTPLACTPSSKSLRCK
jgi:hypothetical protein